jgi:hypothetical protein
MMMRGLEPTFVEFRYVQMKDRVVASIYTGYEG